MNNQQNPNQSTQNPNNPNIEQSFSASAMFPNEPISMSNPSVPRVPYNAQTRNIHNPNAQYSQNNPTQSTLYSPSQSSDTKCA